MKLLIIGCEKSYALDLIYARLFKASGIEVELFPAHDMVLDYRARSTFHKGVFRLIPNLILNRINREIKDKIKSYAPNVVLIFKGLEVYPETISYIKGSGIKVANYNADHPLLPNSRGSINENIRKSLPLFDLYMTYNKGLVKELEQDHHIKSAWIPFGFDVSDAQYIELTKETELMSCCFLGNPDASRLGLVKKMLTAGLPVAVYGNDWDRDLAEDSNNALLKIFGPVYGEEFWSVLRKYRVQLNDFRNHNIGSHNMRSYDVPGVGGILLTPYSDEQAELFEDKKEVFFYRNEDEAVSLAQEILAMETEQADSVRIQARERSVNDKYAYRDRAEVMLNELRAL